MLHRGRTMLDDQMPEWVRHGPRRNESHASPTFEFLVSRGLEVSGVYNSWHAVATKSSFSRSIRVVSFLRPNSP